MNGSRITTRFDAALKRQLEAFARTTGRSESDIVREAVREHLRTRPAAASCYDLASRAGMIGAANDLPPDLSSNSEHMKGFGR